MSLLSLNCVSLLAMPLMAALVPAASIPSSETLGARIIRREGELVSLPVPFVPDTSGVNPAAEFINKTDDNGLQARDTPTYVAQGCFREPGSGRALRASDYSSDSMTTESCASFCSGFKYFGTEFGRECWCDNNIASGAASAEGQCTMPCKGNPEQTCGAPDHLNIYENTGYAPTSIATVNGYTYKGCRTEARGGRALPDKDFSDDNMTPQLCANFCAASGYLYAGVEWGKECFCGHSLHGGNWVDDSKCQKPCAGDKRYFCGEGGHLSVYGPASVTVATVPDYEHLGCAVDATNNRVLTGHSTGRDDMTAAVCASICSNYAYFGVEFGRECYCGNSVSSPQFVDASQCSSPCIGDGTTLCGNDDRINIYKATKTAQNSAAVGNFKYLQCSADEPGSRALTGDYTHGDSISVTQCAAFCSNYKFFGVEYGRECFCGNSFDAAATKKPEGDCYMKCSGDSTQVCGAAGRISVYSTKPQVCGQQGLCNGSWYTWYGYGLATPEACRQLVMADKQTVNDGFVVYLWGGTYYCWGSRLSVSDDQCNFWDLRPYNEPYFISDITCTGQ